MRVRGARICAAVAFLSFVNLSACDFATWSKMDTNSKKYFVFGFATGASEGAGRASLNMVIAGPKGAFTLEGTDTVTKQSFLEIFPGNLPFTDVVQGIDKFYEEDVVNKALPVEDALLLLCRRMKGDEPVDVDLYRRQLLKNRSSEQ